MKLLVLRIPEADLGLWSSDPAYPTLQWLLQSATSLPLSPQWPPGRVTGGITLACGKEPRECGIFGDLICRTADMALVPPSSDLMSIPSIWRYFTDAGMRTALVGVPSDVPQALGVTACLGTSGAQVSELDLGPEARLKAASVENFETARELIKQDQCDVLYLNEVGIEGIHRVYWRYHDAGHVFHRAKSGLDGVVRDYYQHLDKQLAATLELATDETAVAVIVDHGIASPRGVFAINEWLMREGLLVLTRPISKATDWSEAAIDWTRTRAFAAGGAGAQVWINLANRSEKGIVPKDEYDSACEDILARLQRGDALAKGWRIAAERTGSTEAQSFIPADIVISVDDWAVPVISSVGHADVCLDSDPLDPCDVAPAGDGMAILTGPKLAPHLNDEPIPFARLAPTLVDLLGLPASNLFPGASAIAALKSSGDGAGMSDEEVLRERLRGLGYIE